MNSLMNAHVLVSVIDRASNMLGQIGQNATDAGNKVKTLKNIQIGAFKGAAAGAASLSLIAATAGKTAVDFEYQMARVKAITNATSTDFKLLEDKALALGGSTVWSSSEVAAGMEYLGMAGWKTQQILDGMPGILNLATAGNIDLARASDISSDVMTAMGLSADKAGHFADVFAKAITSSNTNVEMLGETMKYTAPIAYQYGLSLEETTAISAKMADAGIKSSQAGTSMRAGLLRLATLPKQTAKALKELGISATDSSGNMKNIVTVLSELETAMAPLSQSKKLQLAKGLFGVEAASGWLNVLSAGSAAVGDFSKTLENSTGAAQEMALTMSDNVSGSLKAFWSIMEKIQIAAMKPFLEPLKNALLGITGFLSKNEKLASWLLIGATVLSALLAVGGLIVGIAASAGLATLSLGAMGVGLGTVIAITGGVVAGIAAIGAAAYLIYKNWDKVGPYFKAIWENLKTGFQKMAKDISGHFAPIVQTIKGVFNILFGKRQEGIENLLGAGISTKGIVEFVEAVTTAKEKIKTTFNTIKTVISAVFDMFAGKKSQPIMKLTSAGFSMDKISNLLKGFEKARETISNIFKAVSSIVFSALKAVGRFAMGVFKQIAAWWKKDGATIKEAVANIAQFIGQVFVKLQPVLKVVWTVILFVIKSVWQNIKAIITSGINIITSVINIFAGIFTGDWSKVWENIKSLVSNALVFVWNLLQLTFLGRLLGPIKVGMGFIKTILLTAWNFIKGLFNGSLRNVTSVVRVNFSTIRSVIQVAFNIIRNIVRVAWNAIKTAFKAGGQILRGDWSGAWNTIKSFVGPVWESIRGLVKTGISNMRETVKTWMGHVKTTMTDKWDEVVIYVKELPGKFLEYGTNIITGLWNGIKGAASNLGEKVSRLIEEHIPGPVRKLLGIASPSRLFRQFGNWTMEGLGGGITDGAGGVMRSITNVAKNLAKAPIKGPQVEFQNVIPRFQSMQGLVGTLYYSIEGNMEKLRKILDDFVRNLNKYPNPNGKDGNGNYPPPINNRGPANQDGTLKVELNFQPGSIVVHAANDEDIEQKIQNALAAFVKTKLPPIVQETIRKQNGKKANYLPGIN